MCGSLRGEKIVTTLVNVRMSITQARVMIPQVLPQELLQVRCKCSHTCSTKCSPKCSAKCLRKCFQKLPRAKYDPRRSRRDLRLALTHTHGTSRWTLLLKISKDSCTS